MFISENTQKSSIRKGILNLKTGGKLIKKNNSNVTKNLNFY